MLRPRPRQLPTSRHQSKESRMATPPATTDKKRRSFSMSIDIDATPEEVWRALTDAGELMRWFPLQARVTPGKGGSVFWGWDEHWAWESQIDAWEPERRLQPCREPAGLRCERRTASGPAGAAGDGVHARNPRRENDPSHRPLRVRRRGQLGRRARIGERGLAVRAARAQALSRAPQRS